MKLPAKPHWTEQLDLIRERLQREPRVLVATDFDGTISDIVDHPEHAVLHPAAAAALAKLLQLQPQVRLAVLSGREVSDLTKRLGLDVGRIICAGNHGLEVRGGQLSWDHPTVSSSQADVRLLESDLKHLLRTTPGAEIENKGASLTVHYRRVVAGHRAQLLARLDQVEIPSSLRRHPGKMVVEFRPDVEWHKGFALRAILGLLGIPDQATVYLGDDVTDEDAFREFRTSGITIRVGTSDVETSARLRADGPADAAAFLAALAATFQATAIIS